MRSWCRFFVLLIAASVQAGDYVIVYQDVAPEYASYQCIDPIIDDDRELAGFVFSNSPGNGCVVARFGHNDVVVTDLPSPVSSTINYQSGDTVFVFACGHGEYISPWFVSRSAVVDSQATTTAIQPNIVSWDLGGYWFNGMGSTVIQFTGPSGAPDGIAFQCLPGYMDEPGPSGMDYFTSFYETSLFTVNLVLQEGPYRAAHRRTADLSPYPGEEHAWSQMKSWSWHYYNDPDHEEWGSGSSVHVGMLDSTGDTIFARGTNNGYALALFTGDFDPLRPYVELIFCGLSKHLSDPPGDTSRFIACYSFATGQMEELWYHQFSGKSLDYLTSDGMYIAGWLSGNRIGITSTTTGECVDTIQMDHSSTAWRFFDTGDPANLNLVARNGDTIFVYQFDAPTAVDNTPPDLLPVSFSLAQNYPNPFNDETVINFTNTVSQHLRLSIHNVLGQEVAVLHDAVTAAGAWSVSWNGRYAAGNDIATGVYFARLKAETGSREIKMMYVK